MAWIEVYGLLKFIEQSENSGENYSLGLTS